MTFGTRDGRWRHECLLMCAKSKEVSTYASLWFMEYKSISMAIEKWELVLVAWVTLIGLNWSEWLFPIGSLSRGTSWRRHFPRIGASLWTHATGRTLWILLRRTKSRITRERPGVSLLLIRILDDELGDSHATTSSGSGVGSLVWLEQGIDQRHTTCSEDSKFLEHIGIYLYL